MTEPQWRVLQYRARRRAFWVAGATQAQVVLHVWHAIDDALRQGVTFREFRARVLDSLTSQWGREIPGRIETIFRTNIQSAYSAGRWWQLNDPEIRKVRSWWLFEAVLDSRTTEICRARHGVALPASDVWWRFNYPPLHFDCRSGVRALTEDEVADGDYMIGPQSGTPDVPRGWGAEPTAMEWTPDLSQYPPEIAQALRRKIAEAGLVSRPPKTPEITEDDLTRIARAVAEDWASEHGTAWRVRNVAGGDTWPKAYACYLSDTGDILLDRQRVLPLIQVLSSKERFVEWLKEGESKPADHPWHWWAGQLETLMSMKFGPRWRERPWRELRTWLLKGSSDISGALKTYTHEITHGVRHAATDWSRYREDNVYGALQEAVTEIWAHLSWRTVAQRLIGVPADDLPEVDLWTARMDDPAVPVRWSYRGPVVALRELLKMAGLDGTQFVETVRYLKFRVPMQDRPAWLIQRLLDAHPRVARDPERVRRLSEAIFRMTTYEDTVSVVEEVRAIVQGP